MRPEPAELERIVRHLASWERPSASEGERRAAEWIAGELRSLGFAAQVEDEPAHGGYWWPLGLLNAAAAVAGLAGRRAVAAVAGAVAALGVHDELTLHRAFWTRRLLPKRRTFNVVAEAGDASAPRTVVVVGHHDAAHGGLIFDFTLVRLIARTLPRWLENARVWPRIMWLVFAGPVLVALGGVLGARRLRRLGTLFGLGSAAAFADIALRKVVPGANDNLTGVATVLGVARGLAAEPVRGIRVLLVSTGSEESFEEGMLGFLRTHAGELPRDSTFVVAIDTVGSPRLVLLEGEGMLVPTGYDTGLKEELAAAAADEGVDVIREHWLSFGSDALAAVRHGYRAALLASFDEYKLPANYHKPTDTPDNVDYERVADAVALIERAVRRLARS